MKATVPWSESRWHTASKASPEYRVHWLLRAGLSPDVRRCTIDQLLKDPATREATLRELGHST